MIASELLKRPVAELSPHLEGLRRHGYCLARDILPAPTLTALSEDIGDCFENTPFCLGGFYGERTKRFGSLLARSTHAEALVCHPLMLGLAASILGPWCDTIQLNLMQAIELHPGALPQFPHRDQDMWRGPVGAVEYLVNVIWPLTSFKESNGATIIWPDSHGVQALEPTPTYAPIVVECDPGSAIIFLGSTLHGAGGNRSQDVRRGVIVSYCLGWLKPYENQWLVYPPQVARRFRPELAQLIGYVQHRPNLGNYEGQSPEVLLQDKIPAHFSAADALRPDQAAAVADFVARQRAATASRHDELRAHQVEPPMEFPTVRSADPYQGSQESY
ncbi:phytanoyl-CoA dioxygenase family protein [Methylocystis iwaonis]|uniref:Phytanoyl-CoA dioxygenase family protein n=1 Tax=Methylocystis iwaonis TaxID=2885079 RepID=A0ABM8EEC1_9HYPH|nr:phytanoyl-CoA dioxygenase family protein [Methylocystis iwaonis]BDV36367.1 hypothetical protein SS37A_38970 [Methylocystis iwaonis]